MTGVGSAMTGTTEGGNTEGQTEAASDDSLSESASALDKSLMSCTTGGRETELGKLVLYLLAINNDI